mmetsp:Transcript_19096/g.57673  ORF Transcript_19096/g.57673 Transcript_19096/m.57673 type:complete len:228 (+) Transcript_19096:1115-1798(+)
MAVTVFLLFSSAYSNAYCAVRRDFSAVITLRDSTTPGTTSCSSPLYSPSVFSRMTTMSMFSCRVLRPGMEKPCTRLTCRSSFLRSCTFRLCVLVVLSSAVKSVPLRQVPLRLMEARMSSGTKSLGSPKSFDPLTLSNRSQMMGAPSASTTLVTESVTSGPMPSPGMRVTTCGVPSPGNGTYVITDLPCDVAASSTSLGDPRRAAPRKPVARRLIPCIAAGRPLSDNL